MDGRGRRIVADGMGRPPAAPGEVAGMFADAKPRDSETDGQARRVLEAIRRPEGVEGRVG